MARRLMLTTLLMVSASFAAVTWAQTDTAPAKPLPMTEKQAIELFSSLFGRRYADVRRTGDPSDDADLAKVILEAATPLKDNPTFQRFCYERVVALAANNAAGVDYAIDAARRLIDMGQDVTNWCMKLLPMYQVKYRVTSADDRGKVAGEMIDVAHKAGDLLRADRRSVEAIGVYKQVLPYVRSTDSSAVQDVGQWIGQARQQIPIDSKVAALQQAVSVKPIPDTARQLIWYLVCYYDDSAGAAQWVPAANEPTLTRMVKLMKTNQTDLTTNDLSDLGTWYRQQADKVEPFRKKELLIKAVDLLQAGMDRNDVTGIAQLKLKVALQEAGDALSKLSTIPTAGGTDRTPNYHVVIFNNIRGGHFGIRGAKKVNVHLYHQNREVAAAMNVDVPWIKDDYGKAQVDLYAIMVDRVRVEITQWEDAGGGLAEIQVLRGSTLISQGKPVKASESMNEKVFPPSNLVDGKNTTYPWYLPNSKPGWAEIDLSGK